MQLAGILVFVSIGKQTVSTVLTGGNKMLFVLVGFTTHQHSTGHIAPKIHLKSVKHMENSSPVNYVLM